MENIFAIAPRCHHRLGGTAVNEFTALKTVSYLIAATSLFSPAGLSDRNSPRGNTLGIIGMVIAVFAATMGSRRGITSTWLSLSVWVL